jgi:hypothetical protein
MNRGRFWPRGRRSNSSLAGSDAQDPDVGRWTAVVTFRTMIPERQEYTKGLIGVAFPTDCAHRSAQLSSMAETAEQAPVHLVHSLHCC